MDLDAIAREVALGDRDAFRVLVERTAPRLLRAVARMLGDAAEAEDALQEAYVKAHRAIVGGDYQAEGGLEAWLYRIAINVALGQLRSRARRRRREQARASTEPAGGEADARLALRELDAWLGELPAEQRAAVVLKELEGLTTAEIAAALGCSVGAVEQRLVRARATLRERRDG